MERAADTKNVIRCCGDEILKNSLGGL